MIKKLLFIALILLFIISCDNAEKEYPTYSNVCSDQELWDDRVNYRDFKCELFNTDKGLVRTCTATELELKDNWEIVKHVRNTTCLNVCIENC